jgi:putative flippase GtrA
MRPPLSALFERREYRFFLTGAGLAGFFWAINFSLVSIGLPAFASSMLAYAGAVGVGYVAQRNWSFRARHSHAKALPRYLALQTGCAVMSGLSAQAATTVFDLPPLPMSLSNTILMGLISYVVSLNWVFPDDCEPE